MLQGFLAEPGRLELREVPVPEPALGEIVVKVEVAMTCGTDLKTFRRGHPKIQLPASLGHEFSGIVERTAPGVTWLRKGDPILIAPSAPCEACNPCRVGLENLCEAISSASMAWGAFAEFVRVPAHVVRRNVFPRSPTLNPRHAALLEPLACVVAGIERLDLVRRETVLVLGAGPIGLLYAMLLKRRGVPHVVVLGKRALRLRAAKTLGADTVVDVERVDPRVALAKIAPHGVCSAIECVGTPDAWLMAIDSVRKGGEVLLYGGCASGTTIPLDTRRLHYDALTLKGAFHFTPSDVRVALDLIQSRALPLDTLVTDSFPLEQLREAFTILDRGDCLKLAILPGGLG